ncbi:DegQ family serine endoprotease [Martelella sp. HB161492]|uniref:DegQ family serine endoprotease n=1 Tax=Martelella sp. HB161492 TaxID=2720726 RepID=UPI001590549B|nr:DegQ family serine endoprotease [Martelella sp. HB161492]
MTAPFIRLSAAAMISGLVLTLQPAFADDARAVPSGQGQVMLSYAPLVKQTAPAVVNVYAERMVEKRMSPLFSDPFFGQFFGQQMPGRSEKQTSLGSGVIVGSDGTIITNNHVIAGADQIKVALSDGREFPCTVLLKDDRYDLAVLKIDVKEALPTIDIGNSDDVEVGDIALAIGDPFAVGQTVTSGIISGLARNSVNDGEFGFFLQTDAAINPGNSGGALLNMKGQLIGINTAIFSKGGGSNGIGFAIPANMVKVFLAAAESGEKSFERPYVGASFGPVSSDIAEAVGLTTPRGAIVSSVVPDGPADKAGLKSGSVVIAVDDVPVQHPDALLYRLTVLGLGKTADLSVERDGKVEHVALPLAVAPETPARDSRTIDGDSPFAGLTVENVSPRVSEELRLPQDSAGVVVADIADGSTANQLGFAKGDIIVSVNDTDIKTTKALEKAAADKPRYWKLTVNRGGRMITQMFR